MFVIVLDTGYVIVRNDEVEADATEKAARFLIKGKESGVKVEPFGSICLPIFDNTVNEYKNAGGSIKQLLDHFNSSSPRIRLTPPYYPFNVLRGDNGKALDLSDTIDLRGNFGPLKAYPVPHKENIVFAFEVDSLNELWFYDLLKIREAKNKFKYCSDCGHVFAAKTNAVRCEKCRAAGMGAKKKIENIKASPSRSCYEAIRNRNKTRQNEYLDTSYFARKIPAIIDAHRNDREYLTALNRMDQWIYTVCICLYNPYGESELKKVFGEELDGIIAAPDPEKRLIVWLKENGIYDEVKSKLPNKSKKTLLEPLGE